MEKALGYLGLPDDGLGLRIVVGGTNGKGSTCTFLDSMLRRAGYRTGHYTSPHIFSARERIQVDGRNVDRALLDQAIADTAAAEAACSLTLTGFEWITVVGARCLSLAKVQVSILEVGLGGRLDAVNALGPQLTVLTPVDLDHCDLLGSSLEGIVAEKTALFRRGAPGVVAAQSPQAAAFIARDLERLGPAPLWVAGRDFAGLQDESGGFGYRQMAPGGPAFEGLRLGLRGRFQATNAAAALAALGLAAQEGLLPALPGATLQEGLQGAFKAGRLQVLQFGGKRVILDAGHNGHAAKALVEALLEENLVPQAVLTGLLATKEPAPVLEQLARLGASLHLCPIPDHVHHAPEALVAGLPTGSRGVAHQDPVAAFRQLLADPQVETLLCFGSHYLLGALCEGVPGLREAAGLCID
jgi:dihydrofolate synthase/folylpolyglutamate synthase